ncbi:MAG: hypothetical protein A6D92_12190, partial [Symbiobacterium thermophilum]
MTPRFFLERVEGDEVVLPRADSHHLLRVLRAGPGTPFVVLSGGMAYDCVLHRVEDGLARGRIRAAEPAAGEPAIRITLFQGLAKGEKMELVLQHGTELGIAEFVAVAAARSVVAGREEGRPAEGALAADRARGGGAVPAGGRAHRPAAAHLGGGGGPHPEFDLALVAWEGGGEPLRAVLEA